MGPKFRNVVLALAVIVAGCAQKPEPVAVRNSELTHGNVQMKIKAGETTQTQILEAFGAPNITSVDASGQEVWTYQRSGSAAQASASSDYWTVILGGASNQAAGFEQTSRMITLIIKFDEKKVVSDFKSRTSNF